jgi:saccharopine dehydrogenase (NAD+, L-lysine forming)
MVHSERTWYTQSCYTQIVAITTLAPMKHASVQGFSGRLARLELPWELSKPKGFMRAALIGSGGVGDAFARIAARRRFLEYLVVADVDPEKAELTALAARESGLATAGVALDARDPSAIATMLREHRIDAVVNACDPRFNPAIFQAAYDAGCQYLDMAMTLSEPHPTAPYEQVGRILGEEQLSAHQAWADKGLLALVAIGVEPGLSDVFARYAADHLFSSIDEIGVRDGGNLVIDGYSFAPTFSIWTTIEECLNPPIIYERDRGWFTTEPFSEPEIFNFPEGIGELECVNVEHEEVLLIPRWVPNVGRVTFKYGLGREFIEILKMLHVVGLDSTKRVRVGDVMVSPRDVVAATLPDPAKLGSRMHGKTCAGTWVKGLDRAGNPSELYLYHVVENEWSMKHYNCQAVVWQTAVNPVVALELIAAGTWAGVGVLGPEAFDAVPFLDLLSEYGVPFQLRDQTVPLSAN